MRILLSLPKETIPYFRSIYNDDQVFLAHDPEGRNVGSGGAVAYLVEKFDRSEGRQAIINAGGESRRLPAYSTHGKVLLPLPVIKWSRGQRIDQRLFDLQRGCLERLDVVAPKHLRTIVSSGDVLVTMPTHLPPVPMEADIVCLGLWGTPEVAIKHGVFIVDKNEPSRLIKMLQKPSMGELSKTASEGLHLIDSGIWLLSDKALSLLTKEVEATETGFLDLYTDFGRCLGCDPLDKRFACAQLTTAIWSPEGARFFHFGSTSDLIESTYQLQNLELDQRKWLSTGRHKHGTIIAQNAQIDRPFIPQEHHIWVENSHISHGWHLVDQHAITGVPINDWQLSLPKGICLDLVPINDGEQYAIRLYHYRDDFKSGSWLGRSFLHKPGDITEVALFPVIGREELHNVPYIVEALLKDEMIECEKVSPNQLLTLVNLDVLEQQRKDFQQTNLISMQCNYEGSVFYQSDLLDTAGKILALPHSLPEHSPPLLQMHDAAFRASWKEQRGAKSSYDNARAKLAEVIAKATDAPKRLKPTNLYHDQIIWARSPVRIDVAGAWTDTPPYYLYEGGGVVNFALQLNGQEPIQVYLKRSKDLGTILLRSIDLGLEERVASFEQLERFNKVGTAFVLPKAALYLCGIRSCFGSWGQLMKELGGGLELTILSALPAGSGLGTSSILGATILAALSEYFGLGWSRDEVGRQTLLLEQLLTTGGGWQDQFGGLYGGVKFITTARMSSTAPTIQWLPDNLFTHPDYISNHLLFYTGLTRVAKGVLANIVDRMMLNHGPTLNILSEIRALGIEMAEIISTVNFERYGRLVKSSWELNKRLDVGTTTPEIEQMISLIDDYALGYKLPGAGGGGFLYIVAKDDVAALHIRKTLLGATSLPKTARFVDMSLSHNGVVVTKS